MDQTELPAGAAQLRGGGASEVALDRGHCADGLGSARLARWVGRDLDALARPHRAGFGFVANADPGFPGFTFEIAQSVPTLAEQLRAAGYATFAIGKWHLTKDSSMSDASDRSSWPTQRGFDRYYGILEGLTNLHHPHRLIRDNSPVAIDVSEA